MHDFGYSIRGQDGELVLKLLVHIFRIFVIAGSAAYAKATGLWLLLLLQFKNADHPVYDYFMSDPSLFNEELGEMSLGALASMIATDTNKSEIGHLSRLYQLQGTVRSIYGEYLISYNLHRGRGGVEHADLNRMPGQSVVAFLRSFVQKNEYKQYRHYTGAQTSWTSLRAAEETACRELIPVLLDQQPAHVTEILSSWRDAELLLRRGVQAITKVFWSAKVLHHSGPISRSLYVVQDDEPEEEEKLSDVEEDVMEGIEIS